MNSSASFVTCAFTSAAAFASVASVASGPALSASLWRGWVAAAVVRAGALMVVVAVAPDALCLVAEAVPPSSPLLLLLLLLPLSFSLVLALSAAIGSGLADNQDDDDDGDGDGSVDPAVVAGVTADCAGFAGEAVVGDASRRRSRRLRADVREDCSAARESAGAAVVGIDAVTTTYCRRAEGYTRTVQCLRQSSNNQTTNAYCPLRKELPSKV